MATLKSCYETREPLATNASLLHWTATHVVKLADWELRNFLISKEVQEVVAEDGFEPPTRGL